MKSSRRLTHKALWVSVVAGICMVLVACAQADAYLISALGTAEQITAGDYAGWYKYSYDVEWNLAKGLSHLDLVLKDGCAQEDHLFAFAPDTGEAGDGLSTGDNWHVGDPISLTVAYSGSVELAGDPSIGLGGVLAKWEPTGGQPGKQGVGTFWFYSNVIPEYGEYEGIVIAKNGRNATSGDLSGAWPSCSVPHTPEPGTLALLVWGLVAVVVRRRQGR